MRIFTTFTLGLSCLLVPVSVALGDAIYWSTGFGQTIERANLDGTGRQTVTRTGNLSRHIALDHEAS